MCRDLKTRFIVNPRSGRVARALPAVQDHVRHHGCSLVTTARAGHAAQLAREALDEGCELIVAVGGDGTVNEVGGPLIGTGALLGLVPCGSGNGLGRHLGIHGPVSRALGILREGRPRTIDTGVADGHPFLTAAGIGFEAEIAQRFNLLARRGFARYVSTTFSTLRSWHAECLTVVHAGGRDHLRGFSLTVANANQWGNNAYIAPRARIDDGQLDLCCLPRLTAWNALPLVTRLFLGSIDRGSGVHSRSGSRFIVERDSFGPLHTDGEVHSAGTRLEFSIRPASLRIMVPG